MSSTELFLKRLLDNIQDPIFVKNEKHEWVYGNAPFWTLLGDESGEKFLGKDDTALFPKDQVEVFWEVDEKVLQDHQTIVNEEKIQTPDGSQMTAVTTKTPV